jgi:cytoskeletal protein RodZ
MRQNQNKYQEGAVSGSLLAIIGLVVVVLAMGGLAIWAYLSYSEQKTNVDGKVSLAVAEAKKEQSDIDEEKFSQREKEPNRQFAGPDDYGRLVFDYPKTWSVYVARDVSRGGTYEVYLNPITVPPVSPTQQYSLRVTIEEKDYDQVVKTYEALVKKGDLRTSATSANGNNGTRLDGSFSKDIRGSAVIYKVRDKTITLRTDADTFKPDFENVIKTINFNQ